jgi:hypothetical protein
MFPPRHKPLLELGLLPIIYRGNTVFGRHVDDLWFACGHRVLAGASAHGVGSDEHLGDALLGGLEEAQHGGAAGALGLAGEGVRVRERFGQVVLLDEEGEVGAVAVAAGGDVDLGGDAGFVEDVDVAWEEEGVELAGGSIIRRHSWGIRRRTLYLGADL